MLNSGELFSGSLGEVVDGISAAIRTADNKYQPKLTGAYALFIGILLETRREIRGDGLGWLYRRWFNSSPGSFDRRYGWGKFMEEYNHKREELTSPDDKIRFNFLPKIVRCDLPRIVAYEGNGVYDMAKVNANTKLQTSLARTLGVLGEGETWEDFIRRPGANYVEPHGYEEAEAILRGDPESQLRVHHQDMLHFPFLPSQKHPGVGIALKCFSTEKGSSKPLEQLIAEEKTFMIMSMLFSSDLFEADLASRLQRPGGKAQFRSALCRQF